MNVLDQAEASSAATAASGNVLDQVRAAGKLAYDRAIGRLPSEMTEGKEGQEVLKQEGQKRDDAQIPIHLWDQHLYNMRDPSFGPVPPGWRSSLDVLRGFLLQRWQKKPIALLPAVSTRKTPTKFGWGA